MGVERHASAGYFAVALISALACGGQSLVSEEDGCSGSRCETSGGTAGTSGSATGGSTTGGSAAGGVATGGIATGGTTFTGGSAPYLGPPCEGAAQPTPLRRLTAIDIENTLSDALGVSAALGDTWPTTRTRSRGVTTVSELEALLTLSRTVASVSSSSARFGVPSCAEPYIQALGSALYRRPLLQAEVANYERLCVRIEGQEGVTQAVPALFAAMLLSPYFSFRIEFGDAAGRLSQYELASRLSYFFLRSAPPAELLSADLATDIAIENNAFALLEHPRFAGAMARWIEEWFGIEGFASTGSSSGVPPDLVHDMVGQTRALALRMAVPDGGGFVRLLTSNEGRLTSALADHYGFDVALGGVEPRDVVIDTERYSGILTHGAVLTTYGQASARGALVASALLCREVPPPPASVHAAASLEGSARERYEAMGDACRGCHAVVDPLGFALETYDETARFRDESSEGVIDLDGFVEAFANPMDLGKLLAESNEAAQCTARRMLDYGLDRGALGTPALEIPDGPRDPIPETVEQCLLRSFSNTGRDLRLLAVQIARSTPFRTNAFAPGVYLQSATGDTPLEHALDETEALRSGLSREYQGAELDAYADALRELIARDGAGGASGE